jgi:hypothetical protein
VASLFRNAEIANVTYSDQRLSRTLVDTYIAAGLPLPQPAL